MYLHRIVSDIDPQIPSAPYVLPSGSLLIMVGLPGSGKSSVVEQLAQQLVFASVSTDNVRLLMRNQPTYTAAEMMLVYEVCYALIESRLRRGQRVVFDASNYLAARRQHLHRIAKRCGAPTAVCYVQAAQQVIQERLQRRSAGNGDPSDLSQADWAVYKWMVELQEPLVGEHLILDTTSASPAELATQLCTYWQDCEKNTPSDFDLQPAGWPY